MQTKFCLYSMHELHQSVAAGLTQAYAASMRAACQDHRHGRRAIVIYSARHQPDLSEKPSWDMQLALQVQSSVSQQHQPNQNAARYASAAKRLTAKHQLALQTGASIAKPQQTTDQTPASGMPQQLHGHLDQGTPNGQQEQLLLKGQLQDNESALEQTGQQQLLHLDTGGQQPQQLRSRHLQQQSNVATASLFSQLLHLCDMCARSSSMADWMQGAQCMQQLVQQVSSPLQAQQAWQVAVTLQSHTLHRDCCRVLAGAVVALVEVTLANHDHFTLQQLMAGRLLGFQFNNSHVVRLLRAVTRADVGLEELQALLDMLPAKLLTNRTYYVLINCFMARQQYTEAGHCFHQMEAAGLRLTPSLQALRQQLRSVRQKAAAV